MSVGLAAGEAMVNPTRQPPEGHGAPALVASVDDLTIEIVRSARRRSTIGARLEGRRLIVRVPPGLKPEEERAWAERLGSRILAAQRRRTLNSDRGLLARGRDLDRRYFDGRLAIADVRYVTNQGQRFGSCTPRDRTIRISDRVARMPDWVRDAVLVHELAHLIEPNHSSRFWELANRYPLMERARGYLIALGLEEDAGPEAGAEGC